MSGDTKVLPAPVIVVSLVVAVATVAATSAAATAASVIVSVLVMAPDCPSRPQMWADAVLPAGDGLVNGGRNGRQRDCPSLRPERSSRNRAARLGTTTNAISPKA